MMEKLYWYRMVINFSILIALFVIYLCLKYAVEPSKNAGFYCNDFSVTLPYKTETVNEVWLHVISIFLPFIVLLATESVRAFYTRTKNSMDAGKRNKYRIVLPFDRELHLREYLGNMFVNFEYFLFGLLVNACLTTLVKVLIGRLRPNFLSICNPKLDPYEYLCERPSRNKFLIPGLDFPCSPSANKSQLAESRRSFPSGHSSSTFYTMVYLIFYVNRFWTNKRQLGLVPQFFQVVFFGLAVFVSLSRVLDNMHHPTDVLAGSALGILVAVFTFFYLDLFYVRHNYIGKYDIDMNNSNEMEAFVKTLTNNEMGVNEQQQQQQKEQQEQQQEQTTHNTNVFRENSRLHIVF